MLKKLGILLLGAGCAWAAQAKVDEVQAARLDQDLTPLGAERAGNADGSIPPWTGGITQAPAGYRPGMHHLDPFAADRPRLVLDSRNMAAYQALLTPGTQALLQANPDYHLRVFPTRRSASLPQRLYDATRANASRAELIADGNGVQGAAAGVPFPCRRAARKRSGTTSCATAASNCTCRPTRRRCWPTAATTCSSSTATCTSSMAARG